jgi:hypothetical protein
MIMNRKHLITMFLFVSVAFILAGILYWDSYPAISERDKYEDYLLSLFRDLPVNQDGPEYSGFRDYLMCMDPATGRVPEKAWLKSARIIEDASRQGRLKSDDIFDWEEIPSNTGGRTRALMFDPSDPSRSKVWAGGVTGGLWYNEDILGSGDWKAVDDFWPSLAVSCICHDPNDPGTFYVGTGEGQTAVIIYRESSGRGSGIWKSSNGGENWELLASTENFEYVTDVAVRNESGKSVVYAGVASGWYQGEVHTSKPSAGLYRSEDGGISWEQVLPEIPDENLPYTPAHIEITASGRILIGTMRNTNQKGGGRILRSDNGRDWVVMDYFVPIIEAREINNIPGRVIVASAPSDPDRVYAILSGGDANPDNGFVYSRGVMIIRSNDGGNSWQKVTMPPPRVDEAEGQWSFLAWHALIAAVQPDNPDVVWVGGLDLYRSDDGGWSWGQKSLWWNYGRWYVPEYPVYVHADQHSLIYRPGSISELLNSNDGGVFLATNSTAPAPRFVEVNQGYNTLQYYTCAIHPNAGERYFLGGCQDNGTYRTTNEPTSKNVHVSGGDGTYCFIDEDEPHVQISGSQFNYYYYSTDGSHSHIHYFNFEGGTFINPVDYDDAGNTLYANAMTFEGRFRDTICRIERLNDSVLVPSFVFAGTGSAVPFSAIHVIPWRNRGNTSVLAGSQSGRLFRLDNARSDMQSTEIGSQDFPSAYISCIQTGASASQILVCFSNYGVKHIWETRDGGRNWKDKTGNLPDIPVRWAIYIPGIPQAVMLATELGIWYTLDIGQDMVEWLKAGNFPNVRVDMLSSRASDNHILAGTHGRGLFLSSGAGALGEKSSLSPEGYFHVYPNPATELIHLDIPESINGEHSLKFYDMEGRMIRQERIETGNINRTHQVSVQDMAPGIYVIRLEVRDRYYSQTFIKK